MFLAFAAYELSKMSATAASNSYPIDLIEWMKIIALGLFRILFSDLLSLK